LTNIGHAHKHTVGVFAICIAYMLLTAPDLVAFYFIQEGHLANLDKQHNSMHANDEQLKVQSPSVVNL